MIVKLLHKTSLNGLRHEDGTAAVEFSFLAVPFFLFILCIIEIALLMAHSSILEGATNEAARLIRTGQIQQDAADPEEAFRTALCAHAMIMECNRVQFNVSTISRFAEATEDAASFDEDGNMEDTGFDAGGSGDIVMIRVGYLYSLMTPVIGRFFANYPGNSRLLMSTIVMQTEPYEFE